jgi:hypothetical protein
MQAEEHRVEKSYMRTLTLLVLLLAFGQQTTVAAPATATGPVALALAAVVAPYAPLKRHERWRMARLFDGRITLSHAGIVVTASSVVCRVSNVNIAERSCDLMFRTNKRAVQGREANEIYATMVTAGVVAEGAAGSSIESISKLACTIDPNEIKQKAGGGAECTFETGQ